MYHPRLKGNYYEMGNRYGGLIYKKGFRFPKVSKEKLEYGRECTPILFDFYPEVIEEIKGFADGCQVTYEEVSSFLFSIGVFDMPAQCSIFATYNGSEMLMGRNFDMTLDLKKYTESSLVCPKGRYRYIGHSDVFIGKVDGINEKGLAVAMTYVPGNNKYPGVNFYFIIRFILENCSNVEEAIKILSKVQTSTSNNYLLADSTGGMAVAEVTPSSIFIRRPSIGEEFIVCTNHFVSKEMEDRQELNRINWSKSQERYQTIQDNLRRSTQIDIEKAKGIMSNSEGHVCLNLKEEKFGTLYSLILNLNELSIYRAEGRPNRSIYRKDDRLFNEVTKRPI